MTGRRSSRTWRAAILLGTLVLAWPLAAQKWVVHLPSSPVESSTRQAAALTRLADLLAKKVPGLQIEPQLFRRLGDAEEFLTARKSEVSLVLCDAALLLDLPQELEPVFRLSHGGKATYRRLVVVSAARSELGRLADLRGKSLSVVESGGTGSGLFLGRTVFGGLLEPANFFGRLLPVSDEIAATNEVLFSQADAALVADFNPLLAARRDKELRVIWTSDELSLPILAQRGLSGEQTQALAKALQDLASDPASREILDGLGIDGFLPIPERERLALRKTPLPAAKRYELTPPTLARISLPPPPPASELPLTLELGLPQRKSFTELIDGLAGGH